MAKYLLLIAALLCATAANADNSKANAPVVVDSDGFKEPLSKLKFNPGLDQREFERSTLSALNVYDPLEQWNRRVYHFDVRDAIEPLRGRGIGASRSGHHPRRSFRFAGRVFRLRLRSCRR